METAGRTLSPQLLSTLTHWPRLVGRPPAPKSFDLTLLRDFIDEQLRALPWWNPAWRVVRAGPAHPHEIAADESRHESASTEVSVPGTVSGPNGSELGLSARIRFEGDRLLRFSAKVGDVVLEPAVAPASEPEPHPFGAVLARLMARRGLTVQDMARRTARAAATINGLRAGRWTPHRILVEEVADALELHRGDLLAMAGLDDPDADR
ncbi:helix-turn-helix domain-containing protein [Dactylosporangium darangshiense]|uniref:HTH cro/C1-type domain-containing protein n=1 Tax=Dactylosporangium darangshiense TaxID=579108 RepID=A0ABP8DB37_9ACTN